MKYSLCIQLRAGLLLGILLVFCTHKVAAQHVITGRVIDQQTESPLAYASVVIKAGDRVIQSTLTNEKGLFVLKCRDVGTYQLTIPMLGFIPFTQEVNVAVELATVDVGTLALVPAEQKLQEVVVTGTRPLIEQKLDRIIMNIDGSMLATGNDAYSILSVAPSVQLIEGRLSLRGKSNVLIILDGKRLPGANLEAVLSSISGDQIERIELITNPSSKYDASASGGVIEIYTKRSKGRGWEGNIGGNLSQGRNPGGGGNAGLRASTPKLDVAASGAYSQRGSFERGYQNRTLYQGLTSLSQFSQDVNLSHETVENGNFDGSVNFHFDPKNTLGFDLNVVHAGLRSAGQVNTVINQLLTTDTSTSLNNMKLQGDLSSYNVFLRRSIDSLGSNILLCSNLARYKVNQEQDFDQLLETTIQPTRRNAQFRNSAPATYRIYTTAFDYTKKWSSSLSLESGAKYATTENNSSQIAEVRMGGIWMPQDRTPLSQLGYHERVSAAYVNLNRNWVHLGVQAGLRAEHTQYSVIGGIDSSYFNLFPNFRADYKFSERYSTSLSYAKNINRPSYNSLIPYELFLDNYTSQRGNAYLKPEYAHSFNWNQLYKEFGLQLEYTLTDNTISSLYLYSPANSRLIMTERNFHRRHLSSATFSVPFSIAKWWSSVNTASFLYQVLDYPDSFHQEIVQTKRKSYYTLTSDNTFTLNKGWTIRIYGAYNSPSFNGLLDFGTYSYVSTGIRKSFWNKTASLKLEVVDLFFQSSLRISSSVAPVVSDGLLRNDTRRLRLSFSYKLGQNNLVNKRVRTDGNAKELNRLGL
jgi:outer membrane receptor protein involved in Fe transport